MCIHRIALRNSYRNAKGIYACSIGVTINEFLITQHAAPLVHSVEPTLFLALTLIRSDIMPQLLGDSLSKDLRRISHSKLFCGDADPVGARTDLVVAELVAAKHELASLKSMLGNQTMYETQLAEIRGTSLICQRPRIESCDSGNSLKTATVRFAMKCRLAFKHVPTTLLEAEDLLDTLREHVPAARDSFHQMCCSTTVGRHALLLDSAIEMHMAARMRKLREDYPMGRMLG